MKILSIECSATPCSVAIIENGKIIASVKVKNIGKYTAKEAVQMYIQDLFGSVVRPVKELKGFKKIITDLLTSKEFDVKEAFIYP